MSTEGVASATGDEKLQMFELGIIVSSSSTVDYQKLYSRKSYTIGLLVQRIISIFYDCQYFLAKRDYVTFGKWHGKSVSVCLSVCLSSADQQ